MRPLASIAQSAAYAAQKIEDAEAEIDKLEDAVTATSKEVIKTISMMRDRTDGDQLVVTASLQVPPLGFWGLLKLLRKGFSMADFLVFKVKRKKDVATIGTIGPHEETDTKWYDAMP